MGWGKKVLGGLAVAGGIVSEIAVPGNPLGIAAIGAGGATIATDRSPAKSPGQGVAGNTQKKAQAVGSSSTVTSTAPPKPLAPAPASSLRDSRSQQRGRMLGKYNFKPWSGA